MTRNQRKMGRGESVDEGIKHAGRTEKEGEREEEKDNVGAQ